MLPRPKEEDKQFFNINQEEINQAEDRGDIPDSESPDPDIQPTPVKKTRNRRVWQQVPKFQRYTRSKGSTIATPEAEAAKDPGSSSLLSQSKLKDLTQPPGEINSAYLIKGLETFRYVFAAAKSNIGEPQSLKEALAGPDAAKWRMAIRLEYEAIQRKKTWTLVKRHEVKGHKILRGKLVLRKKHDKDGNILKYKA